MQNTACIISEVFKKKKKLISETEVLVRIWSSLLLKEFKQRLQMFRGMVSLLCTSLVYMQQQHGT